MTKQLNWKKKTRLVHELNPMAKHTQREPPPNKTFFGEPARDTLTTAAEARVPVAKFTCTKIVYL